MTQHTKEDSMKFKLALHPWPEFNIRSESLWGHWLDQEQGLVSCKNNAFYVPLAVNDTVRVARDRSGMWQVVEIVRLAESVVTLTSFDPPVTPKQAVAVYDGWVAEGKSVYTEGPGNGMMVTAWREFLSVDEVLEALSQCSTHGWAIWEILTPERRNQELVECVDLVLGG